MKKLFFLLASLLVAQDDIDLLLDKLQKADDLSKKTIQESAGYVITYTREDLDRMKIKSLKELLERIPFLRYNEDANGLSDLVYIPFQPTRKEQIRVYIDDKEVTDPLYGNGLQVFSEMDISYIDHIEIYMGAVSFTLGMEPSIAIIKLYTKEPSRENIDLIDLSYATYGTKDVTLLSAQELEEFEYLLYLNHRNLHRQKVHYKSANLSRDKDFDTLFFKLKKGDIRFDFYVSRLKIDSFTGEAISLEPSKAYNNVYSYYAGLYYKKDGLKAFVTASYSNIWHYVHSDILVGLLPSRRFPIPYKTHQFKSHDFLLDSELSRQIQLTSKLDLLIGLKGRAKRFDFVKNSFDQLDKSDIPYDSEDIATAFLETKYLLDQNNIFTFSLKYDKYYESGPIRNYIQHMVRVGYIYNTEDITTKLFAIQAKFKPSVLELIEAMGEGVELDMQKVRIYAIEWQKRFQKSKLSLFATRLEDKNVVLRDLKSLKLMNNKKTLTFHNFDIRYKYEFDLFNSIEAETFMVIPDYGNGMGNKLYGAHLVAYNRVGDIDIYNSLVYRDWTRDDGDGIDYSFTLSYSPLPSLRLYLKGINIFDTAIKTNYYGYDLASRQLLKLPEISVIDRQIWVGLEYQF